MSLYRSRSCGARETPDRVCGRACRVPRSAMQQSCRAELEEREAPDAMRCCAGAGRLFSDSCRPSGSSLGRPESDPSAAAESPSDLASARSESLQRGCGRGCAPPTERSPRFCFDREPRGGLELLHQSSLLHRTGRSRGPARHLGLLAAAAEPQRGVAGAQSDGRAAVHLVHQGGQARDLPSGAPSNSGAGGEATEGSAARRRRVRMGRPAEEQSNSKPSPGARQASSRDSSSCPAAEAPQDRRLQDRRFHPTEPIQRAPFPPRNPRGWWRRQPPGALGRSRCHQPGPRGGHPLQPACCGNDVLFLWDARWPHGDPAAAEPLRDAERFNCVGRDLQLRGIGRYCRKLHGQNQRFQRGYASQKGLTQLWGPVSQPLSSFQRSAMSTRCQEKAGVGALWMAKSCAT
eukprot:scaffold1280_cov246-Pinguiococcus_pyrenoidosus.AAC.16